MTDFVPAETTFTGRKMLLTITAFFGVIIAVNGTMLSLAVSTFGGLVVQNSYVASQQFNENIEAVQAQPIRAWDIGFSSEESTVSLTVKDAAQVPVTDLSLTLMLARPTHSRETIEVALTQGEPGTYSGKAVLANGQWRATAMTDDGQVRSFLVSLGGK